MFFYLILSVFIFICTFFIIAIVKKDNSIIDIGWGLGFILISVISLSFINKLELKHLIINTLTIIWGLRLSIYLFIRNHKKGEDFRYKKWRDEWKNYFIIRSFFQVFLLQGVFMIIIALPIINTNSSSNFNFQINDFLGILIWIFGFYFQAMSDYQLFKFKKDIKNKNKIMRYGLWKYTRHPNYFGEAVMWWSIFIISIGAKNELISLISPITINFLLLKVSGVPMLEDKYKSNQEYLDYIKNTSSFIPKFKI
ncbi:MAG: DUF1295 domain-containing protein [Candidatus Sericytochromatia bacterium]